MRATNLLLTLAVLFVGGCESCHREPPIIIRFEPIDAAGQPPVAAPARDLASSAPAGKPADLGATTAAPSKAAKAATVCKVDADCVLENADCCGCNAMGAQHAVHRADRKTPAARSKECGDTMCAQGISGDASCLKKAACVAGKCALK